jgi:hypothetical protein
LILIWILKCASAQRFAQRYAQLSLVPGKIEALKLANCASKKCVIDVEAISRNYPIMCFTYIDIDIDIDIDSTACEKVLRALSLAARSVSISKSISKWKFRIIYINRTYQPR